MVKVHSLCKKLKMVFCFQDILRECVEQVDVALNASRWQSEVNPKYPNHSGNEVQDCGGEPQAGNVNESGGSTVDCRQSHNTPTDVDMVF